MRARDTQVGEGDDRFRTLPQLRRSLWDARTTLLSPSLALEVKRRRLEESLFRGQPAREVASCSWVGAGVWGVGRAGEGEGPRE